ncbi:MAG: hypothetical protein LC792_02585, partial [Actinobacteria bacterium]|nr:hypothetical protein [Actinomycetota bacterium]
LTEQGRRLALARARQAVAERAPRARGLSLAVALDPGHPAGTRMKALVAAMAPGVARRVLTSSGEDVAGAGGLRSAGALD